MRIAFKEWAVVADAIGRGDQIIILRKGGISEGRSGFQIEHNRFFLFPTLFHQQRESVQPTAQLRYDVLAPKLSPSSVRIEVFVEVVDWKFLDSLEAALRLRGQHIWREEVIRDRFDWGKSKSIYALAVRAFRLPRPVELPMRVEYRRMQIMGGIRRANFDGRRSTGADRPRIRGETFSFSQRA